MGSVMRKTRPNQKIDGSKLIVEGQGILTKKISPSEKIPFVDRNSSKNSNQNTQNQ